MNQELKPENYKGPVKHTSKLPKEGIERKFKNQFIEIIEIIKKSRINALKSINAELINLYWRIGGYISRKLERAEWGEGVVSNLAEYIQTKHPEFKGFNRRGLFRMRQFYETYSNNSKVSPLVTQISWSNHLLILSKTKSMEEKEFYVLLTIKERYSKRELERQIDSGYYERSMISGNKLSPLARELKPDLTNVFKDTYMLDFLNLSKNHTEKDLRLALVNSFKDFVLEFGKDFAFLGKEYRLQIGKNDYFIDLLFYHRELQCLVAFELKIDDFKPEYLGKLNFYLEALDRDIKKTYENPSVGIILCKSKDEEVVKYALKRNMSPALISEYKTKLIPKKILRNKLHELFSREEERLK